MDTAKVPPRSATELAGILGSPEVARLIAELEVTRWTGRPGYPLRAMVGLALAKSIYSTRRGREPWRSSASTMR